MLIPPPIVTVPTTVMPVPLGSKLRTSPPTVTRPPGVSVSPAITTLVIGGWDGRVPVLVTKVVGDAVVVTPLRITTFPVGDRDIVCPETVIAPPGVKVCEPMTNADFEFSVYVEEPISNTGLVLTLAVGVGEGNVMTAPPTVIAPPGKRVWELMTKPPLELAVTVWPSITTTAGGVVVGVGVGSGVKPLMIIAPPELAEIR